MVVHQLHDLKVFYESMLYVFVHYTVCNSFLVEREIIGFYFIILSKILWTHLLEKRILFFILGWLVYTSNVKSFQQIIQIYSRACFVYHHLPLLFYLYGILIPNCISNHKYVLNSTLLTFVIFCHLYRPYPVHICNIVYTRRYPVSGTCKTRLWWLR